MLTNKWAGFADRLLRSGRTDDPVAPAAAPRAPRPGAVVASAGAAASPIDSDYLSLVRRIQKAEGLDRGAAIRLANARRPDLRAQYARGTAAPSTAAPRAVAAIAIDPAYAGFTDYMTLVRHIQAAKSIDKSSAIRLTNKARPDLRAKYVGRAGGAR